MGVGFAYNQLKKGTTMTFDTELLKIALVILFVIAVIIGAYIGSEL